MMRKAGIALVSVMMMAVAFGVVASAGLQEEVGLEASALDNYLMAKRELERQESLGVTPASFDAGDYFTYTDGPYPIFLDDGSPPGPKQMPWGSHYVSEVMYSPPHNPGGWNSIDATGGVGLFTTGNTHESWIGDQNGDGDLGWVAGFSYRPWGEDGIDNDGDGCIDEKSFWQWDPHRGIFCDLIPDQITYYETGGLPDAGGDDGDLLINVDWYDDIQATEIWRAFVSPKWMAYKLRGFIQYPQAAGDFFSYYAHESYNLVNANPEMDNDQDDWYVGNIDARGFPSKAPRNHICAAGYQMYMGVTFKRDDGWVVTSFELREYHDGKDWNGDGDASDPVVAYYAINPNTGKCRDNVVNTGVSGIYPRNTGTILTPSYTYEGADSRDWDQDNSTSAYPLLYHEINTTWAMKGKVYTSYTFTATVPAWGFGWWALYSNELQVQTFPLKFGGAFKKYVGGHSGYYHTYFFLTSDEDGDRHTTLQHYDVGIGTPAASPGGVCILTLTPEAYAGYAGLWFMPTVPGDVNGDGDAEDTAWFVYCPDEVGGGGKYIIENTSKYAKGMYIDPIPFIELGYVYYSSDGTDSNGLCALSFFYYEPSMHDDADGNLVIESVPFHMYYWIDIDNLGPGSTHGSSTLTDSKESPGYGQALDLDDVRLSIYLNRFL